MAIVLFLTTWFDQNQMATAITRSSF